MNPGTNRQVPDQAIVDMYGKQAYLGNSFTLPIVGFSPSGTSENKVALIQNPSVTTSSQPYGWRSLFMVKRRASSSLQPVQIKHYINPTFSLVGIQTIVTRADSSGDLNNKYWKFFLEGGAGYYVWYNINSGGTDPALAGLTGIQVAAATNAASTAIASATNTAINSASAGVTSAVVSSTVTITNTASGPFSPAVDGAAPTTFTLAVTGGVGTLLTPLNVRPASTNTSLAVCSLNPICSANGTLIDTLEVPSGYSSENTDYQMIILDPGKSMLITATALVTTTAITLNKGWNEI